MSALAARAGALWGVVRGEVGRTRKLRGLVELLRPYRGRVALMFVAMLLATGAALAPPYLAGRAIDDGIRARSLSALGVVVALFLAAALVNWGASYAQTYLVNWVGQRALQDLRLRIFRHLQRLSIGFYSRNRAGVLISRITNDVQALDQLVTDGVQTLFSSTLTLIGTAAILLFLDPQLALVTFLVFPVLFVASIVFRLASGEAYRLTREKVAWVTAYLQETISGVREVQAFGRERANIAEFREVNAANRDANIRAVSYTSALQPALEALGYVAVGVVTVVGGLALLRGEALFGTAVTLGLIITFLGYAQRFNQPIAQIATLWTNIQSAIAGAERIFALLDERPEIVDSPGAIELPPVRGEVEFRDVWSHY